MKPRSIQSLYRPEVNIFRKFAKDYKDLEENKILYRAIVTFVDRIGTDTRPRFSIKAKIYGIDDFENADTSQDLFFEPLLPIHIIAVPEIGEEVFIICEQPKNLQFGYWISRTNKLNKLTKVSVGDDNENADNITQKYGYPFSNQLVEENDESPNKDIPESDSRIKPGDVIVQGRSNTSIKQTFDIKNKNGIIEAITGEENVNDSDFYKDEYRKTTGSRIVLSTQTDLDSLIIQEQNNLEFHDNFNGQKNVDVATLLLEAEQLRIISRSGKRLQHAVLAEEQQIWLNKLIDLIQNLITIVKNHTHMTPTGISSVLLPQERIDIVTNKDDFETHRNKIQQQHSETIVIN